MKIIVNGKDHETVTNAVSYSLVVEMAEGSPTERDYTVTYRRGPDNKSGSLQRGNIMDVCDGTRFEVLVSRTD